MVEIFLILIIILVVLFDRLNFNLNNKTKNQVELIDNNTGAATRKGFTLLEIILAFIFFILTISIFFNFRYLSDIILNFLVNYFPFVFVYEEIAFYTLISISSVWFVIRFHFISLSYKKIIARELFNFLFIILFVFVGHFIFNSKNLNINNRYVTSENITPKYTFSKDAKSVNYYETEPFNVLYYNRKYFSFKGSLSSEIYPNTFTYIEEGSRENNRLNYKIIDRVFYVYGEGLILNGLLVYYFIKLLLSSIIWGIKTLKE